MSFIAAFTVLACVAGISRPVVACVGSRPDVVRALASIGDDWLAVDHARDNPPL